MGRISGLTFIIIVAMASRTGAALLFMVSDDFDDRDLVWQVAKGSVALPEWEHLDSLKALLGTLT